MIAGSLLATVALVLLLDQACLGLLRRIRLVLIEKYRGFLLGRVGVVQVHRAAADHVGVSELFLANRAAVLCRLISCVLGGTATSCRMLIFS